MSDGEEDIAWVHVEAVCRFVGVGCICRKGASWNLKSIFRAFDRGVVRWQPRWEVLEPVRVPSTGDGYLAIYSGWFTRYVSRALWVVQNIHVRKIAKEVMTELQGNLTVELQLEKMNRKSENG